MSEQDNVRLVQNAYDCFKRGNIADLVNLNAEDIVWITPGPSDIMRTAGTRHGREGVKDFFSTLSAQEDIEVFEPKEFIAQGDRVVAIANVRCRVKATGKTAETMVVHLFTIKDGKIKRFQELFDTAAILPAFESAKAAMPK